MFPHILCQNSMKSPAYSSRPHQKLAKNGLKCPQIKKWYKIDPNWNLISHSLSNFLTVYNVHKLRNCKVVDFWSWRVGEVSGNTVQSQCTLFPASLCSNLEHNRLWQWLQQSTLLTYVHNNLTIHQLFLANIEANYGRPNSWTKSSFILCRYTTYIRTD